MNDVMSIIGNKFSISNDREETLENIIITNVEFGPDPGIICYFFKAELTNYDSVGSSEIQNIFDNGVGFSNNVGEGKRYKMFNDIIEYWISIDSFKLDMTTTNRTSIGGATHHIPTGVSAVLQGYIYPNPVDIFTKKNEIIENRFEILDL